MRVKTPIIPVEQQMFSTADAKELDFEAIAIFSALGFFLDQDTYWTNLKVRRPGYVYEVLNDENTLPKVPWFEWHYSPKDRPFHIVLEEFTDIFEMIMTDQVQRRSVILPLSGGLDSRSQAAALMHLGNRVNSYSYQFRNGYSESKFGRKIAHRCNFEFKKFEIPRGYLWSRIDGMAQINGCYSEFTAARQMGVIDQLSSMHGVLSLGHWGDVLFDNMRFEENTSNDTAFDHLFLRIIKPGGIELGSELWKIWGLSGSFENRLRERTHQLFDNISIDDPNAKCRAFKSLYWAPRWTSVNLGFFKGIGRVEVPFYDNRMCEFICSVPENYLKGRQIQIAYIKKRAPELAEIMWQDVRPYNLYTYTRPRKIKTTFYKFRNRAEREIRRLIGKKYVQRNWELQFLGKDNRNQMQSHLLLDKEISWLPLSIRKRYFDKFYQDPNPANAHSLTMLLTMVKFNTFYGEKK